MMFYEKEDAEKWGLKIADFDLCNTRHLYDPQKKGTLCGHHKTFDPIGLWDPEWETNICKTCKRILNRRQQL